MMIFVPYESFSELHSHCYGTKRRQIRGKKGIFSANWKKFKSLQ